MIAERKDLEAATLARIEKECSGCGRSFPLTGFYKNRSNKDGRATRCIECTLAYMRAWRQRQDPEQLAARSAERVRRRRATGAGRASDKAQSEAYRAASRKLREAHRNEFDAIYRRERYERGLRIPTRESDQ